jgi:hypothetical protein
MAPEAPRIGPTKEKQQAPDDPERPAVVVNPRTAQEYLLIKVTVHSRGGLERQVTSRRTIRTRRGSVSRRTDTVLLRALSAGDLRRRACEARERVRGELELVDEGEGPAAA